MYVNIINSYRDVIAIADKELVGQIFEEGERQLDVKKSFYLGEKGKEMSREEIAEVIDFWVKEDATFNLVGEKTIQLALEIGLVVEEGIGKVEGVPYALVLL